MKIKKRKEKHTVKEEEEEEGTFLPREKESQSIIVYLLVKDTCSLGPLEKKDENKKKRVKFMVQRKKFSSFIISEGARRLTGLDSIDSRIIIGKKNIA